jgi:hypothetical protein
MRAQTAAGKAIQKEAADSNNSNHSSNSNNSNNSKQQQKQTTTSINSRSYISSSLPFSLSI